MHLPVTGSKQHQRTKRQSRKNNAKEGENWNGRDWNEHHPARELLYNEIKAGNIPLDEEEMRAEEIYNHYCDTLEFLTTQTTFDEEFVLHVEELRRLVIDEYPHLVWNNSHPGRKLLLDEPSCGAIPLEAADMDAAEVHNIYSEYPEFLLKGMEYGPTFQRRLRDLRKLVARDRTRAAEDMAALKSALSAHPVFPLNHRGQPHWNGSVAQALLQCDMALGRHKEKDPSLLRMDRVEYQVATDKKQFRDKVQQEERNKKYLHTLKYRSEQKLKKNLFLAPKIGCKYDAD